MENVKQFVKITDEMAKAYEAKNADYGNSFDKTCDEFGIVAAVVRISDKVNRIKTLIKSKKSLVKDESIADTLLDLANYAILTLMWLENSTEEDCEDCGCTAELTDSKEE